MEGNWHERAAKALISSLDTQILKAAKNLEELMLQGPPSSAEGKRNWFEKIVHNKEMLRNWKECREVALFPTFSKSGPSSSYEASADIQGGI